MSFTLFLPLITLYIFSKQQPLCDYVVCRLTHQRNFPCPDGQGHQANTPDRSQKVPRHVPQRVKDRCVILLPKTVQKYGDASERANQ